MITELSKNAFEQIVTSQVSRFKYMNSHATEGTVGIEQTHQKSKSGKKGNERDAYHRPAQYSKRTFVFKFFLFSESLPCPGYNILINTHWTYRRAIYTSEQESN
ncbi:hypothetical protein SDC9_181280 [bioreactor metagenome]|uniref:Uncharacterized protein n=1 Tax=bioreactor metagenome TaxID=1076179 RepID=A0A645H438_9ZZZZ